MIPFLKPRHRGLTTTRGDDELVVDTGAHDVEVQTIIHHAFIENHAAMQQSAMSRVEHTLACAGKLYGLKSIRERIRWYDETIESSPAHTNRP